MINGILPFVFFFHQAIQLVGVLWFLPGTGLVSRGLKEGMNGWLNVGSRSSNCVNTHT